MSIYKKNENLKKNISISKKLLLSNIVVTILCTIIILFSKNHNYDHLYLLPFSYLLILLMFSKLYTKPFYEYGLLFYVGQFFIFMRYVLTPLSMTLITNEFQPGPDPKEYEMLFAIILMIYELLWIYITITISMIYANRKKINKIEGEYSLFSNKFVVLSATLFFIVILLRTPEYIIPRTSLAVLESVQFEELDSGFLYIISMVFKCSLFLLLIASIKNGNNKNNFRKFFMSTIILLLFIMMFIDTTRWTMIFMGISGYIVIEKLYPNYRKFLRISVISILIFFVIYTSMIKFWWVIVDSASPIKDVISHMTTQFQAYFSGPRVVAQSLNIKDFFPSINLQTLFNDFLGSIPILSSFINQDNRINVYFNLYNNRYNNSLIMPLVGIGYTYFGVVFSPIFTVFAQWVLIMLDKKVIREKRLEFIFIFTYLGLRLSMSMGFNTQSLITSFITPTLPLILLFVLNRKIYLFEKPGGNHESTNDKRYNYHLQKK